MSIIKSISRGFSNTVNTIQTAKSTISAIGQTKGIGNKGQIVTSLVKEKYLNKDYDKSIASKEKQLKGIKSMVEEKVNSERAIASAIGTVSVKVGANLTKQVISIPGLGKGAEFLIENAAEKLGFEDVKGKISEYLNEKGGNAYDRILKEKREETIERGIRELSPSKLEDRHNKIKNEIEKEKQLRDQFNEFKDLRSSIHKEDFGKDFTSTDDLKKQQEEENRLLKEAENSESERDNLAEEAMEQTLVEEDDDFANLYDEGETQQEVQHIERAANEAENIEVNPEKAEETVQLLENPYEAKSKVSKNIDDKLGKELKIEPLNIITDVGLSNISNDARFSLSEEECSELQCFFEEAINDATEKVLSVFQELAEINSLARYQTVMTHTKNFAVNYAEEFNHEVMSLFDQWHHEGESIHQFILDLEVGQESDDESIVTANELENSMREILVETLSRETEIYEGSERVDLSGYGGKEKLFTDIERILLNFDQDMESIIDDIDTASEDKGEENQIYLNIGGVLSSILTAYKSFFESFRDGMSGNLSEYVSDSNTNAMESVENDKEQLRETAENTGEMLKKISSLFQL